jgi:hypothetical protein
MEQIKTFLRAGVDDDGGDSPNQGSPDVTVGPNYGNIPSKAINIQNATESSDAEGSPGLIKLNLNQGLAKQNMTAANVKGSINS